MKRINNEQILDTIYDLASAQGMKIDKFLEHIEDTFGEPMPNIQGLPEDVTAELLRARDNKKEMRRKNRIENTKKETSAEIKRFREMFPNVAPEDIPQEVWDDVSNGASLAHAYALYLVSQQNLSKYADDINERNSKRGAYAASEGATEPVFTKEQVEKMSDKDVKSNYKGILNAMKNWRFN